MTKIPDPNTQFSELSRGVAEIVPEVEFKQKLSQSHQTQTPLRIKFGADPSRPDLHLGHTVVLQKLRLFQDLGHQVVFIIGDFTAKIGDPTGRNQARPPLTDHEITENVRSYQEQVFKVLDREKTQVVFNGEWLNRLTPSELIHLMSQVTVSQIIARDDFSKRYKSETPIFLHEFLYPVLQGYDSVHLKADIECGGLDQKFNLLMGRELQKVADQTPQALLMMPILEGLDGVQKMSKSLDNAIGITDPPRDMYGKIMSISDELMARYYLLLSRQKVNLSQIHPMIAKKQLAFEIVKTYWDDASAHDAQIHFETQFSRKEIPEDIPEVVISVEPPSNDQIKFNVVDAMLKAGFAPSKNEARRLMAQHAVKINQIVCDSEYVTQTVLDPVIFQVGKRRIAKLIFAY